MQKLKNGEFRPPVADEYPFKLSQISTDFIDGRLPKRGRDFQGAPVIGPRHPI